MIRSCRIVYKYEKRCRWCVMMRNGSAIQRPHALRGISVQAVKTRLSPARPPHTVLFQIVLSLLSSVIVPVSLQRMNHSPSPTVTRLLFPGLGRRCSRTRCRPGTSSPAVANWKLVLDKDMQATFGPEHLQCMENPSLVSLWNIVLLATPYPHTHISHLQPIEKRRYRSSYSKVTSSI